ncbi:HlyD family secretion protein [Pedobacter suwonensis]|uniref:HlyD family efflux transporter periplasmic adaptor subunit n=1 Tax=Pedobacter suwonensis TaxID=332999 RepID=UPI0011A2F73A|nr:HlyD family efflux transporter periplasmic adaptor subunit [Pedobacter suwonensis]
MNKENENYGKLHSEDLQDIISTPPSWLLKRGIGFVFLTFLILLIISIVISYPNIVNTTLTINAANHPTAIKNVSAGIIVKIFKKDGTEVKKNEILAFIESNIDPYEALSVESKLVEILQPSEDLPKVILPVLSNLGPLQKTYGQFYSSYKSYIKINVSDQSEDKRKQQQEAILRLAAGLSEQIDIWKKKNILTAPIPGLVYYSGMAELNQYIEPNTNVFFVSPKNGFFFGTMSISQENIGKVKIGQEVHIRLKSYPYEEYGFIYGKITGISQFPQNNVFISRVEISKKHKNPIIKLKHGMIADAEILTDNYSVMERIWLNIKRSILSK